MANVPNSSLKTWNDGDVLHATDYSQDRSILQTAINDNYAKLILKYDKTDVDNLLNAMRGTGWTTQTIKDNWDLIQAIQTDITNLQSQTTKLSSDGTNYTGAWYNMQPSQIATSTVNWYEKQWTATQGQTVFQLTGSDKLYTPNSETTWVIVGGVAQTVGQGYTETDNKTITLAEGVDAGTVVEMRYFLNNAAAETPITNMVGYQENVANPINTNTAQLAEIIQNLDNFPRLSGETDDTARIQRAIASFSSGGKLFIPAGTYTYNNISGNVLNLPSNFEVFLHPNATIQLTNSYYFVNTSNKSNIKIYSGKIIGNGGTAGNDIIFFGSCDRIEVVGTEVQQSAGNGVNLETCTNCRITNINSHHNYKFAGTDQWGNNNVWENCLLNNNGLNTSGAQIGVNGRGLVFWMTKNCKSLNNQIMYNTEYGFRFYSATGDTQNLEDCLVQGCYFKDNAEVDLLFYDDGNTLYRNKAYNNTIERSLTTGTPITVTGHQSEVKNNTVTNLNGNQTLNAIYFTGADRPIVQSNRINGFASAFGFSATSPQIPNKCLIKENKIYNVATLVTGYVHGGGHVFDDNEITHGGTGTSDVGITLDGNTSSECFYKRNKMDGFYRAIVVDDSAQTIEDNVTTNSTGVGLFKSGSNLANNHIGKNDFDSTYPVYLGALVQYKKGSKPRIGYYNGYPNTLTWDVGDTFINNTPSETGTAGSKYIVERWKCTVAGTPGTWLANRVLTGN